MKFVFKYMRVVCRKATTSASPDPNAGPDGRGWLGFELTRRNAHCQGVVRIEFASCRRLANSEVGGFEVEDYAASNPANFSMGPGLSDLADARIAQMMRLSAR
jgi:hypothetical protein